MFEDDADGAQYGAARDGVQLEFTESGEEVEMLDAGGFDDHRFFVVADSPIRIRRGGDGT